MRTTLKRRTVYIILLSLLVLSACKMQSNENVEKGKDEATEQITTEENKKQDTQKEKQTAAEQNKDELESEITAQNEQNEEHNQNELNTIEEKDINQEQEEEGNQSEEVVNQTEEKEQKTGNEEPKNAFSKTNLDVIDMYLPLSNSEERIGEITHIVIHFSSDVANNPDNPYNIYNIYNIFKNFKVSTHYTIDREGKIYRMVDEDRAAWHAGKGSLPDYPHYENKLNQYSIGIELLAIGTKEELHKLVPHVDYESIDPVHIGYTDAQYESLKLLIDDITKRNPTIKMDRKHIIGHDEYTDRRTDPGSLFDWSRIGF